MRSDEVFDCYRHEQRKLLLSLLINVNLFFLCHQILVNVLASLVCNVVPKSTICFSDVYICDPEENFMAGAGGGDGAYI